MTFEKAGTFVAPMLSSMSHSIIGGESSESMKIFVCATAVPTNRLRHIGNKSVFKIQRLFDIDIYIRIVQSDMSRPFDLVSLGSQVIVCPTPLRPFGRLNAMNILKMRLKVLNQFNKSRRVTASDESIKSSTTVKYLIHLSICTFLLARSRY